jgi:hypothetical protein
LDDAGTKQAPKKLFVDLAGSDDKNESEKKSTDEADASTDTQLSDDRDDAEQTKDDKNVHQNNEEKQETQNNEDKQDPQEKNKNNKNINDVNDNNNDASNNQDVLDERLVIDVTNLKPLTAKWRSLDAVSKKLMPFVEGDRIKIKKSIQEALKVAQKHPDAAPDLDGWTKMFASACNVGGRSKKKTIKHLGVMLASSDPNEIFSVLKFDWFKARAPSSTHGQELMPSADPDGFPR